MRERSILLIAAIVISLIAIGVAVGLLVDPLPNAATSQARLVSQALRVFFGLAAAVFLGVEGLLVFAALRGHLFGDSSDRVGGAWELLWITIPALIVAVIVVYSINVLEQIEAPAPNPLVVEVTGSQFRWDFHYPDSGVNSNELHLPAGERVQLQFTSADVVHSFWVPEFGGKIDAVPGMVTTLNITPIRRGFYEGVCAELCGAGHTEMVADVRVDAPADFEDWLASQ